MKQVKWVDPPHDFKVPWKNGTQFIIDGLLWEVYEMKRPKPHGRALIRLLKVAIAEDVPEEFKERELPLTEPVTDRTEFDHDDYQPKVEQPDRPVQG